MLTDKQAALFIMFAIGKRMQEAEQNGDPRQIEVLQEMMRLMTRDKNAPPPEPDIQAPDQPKPLLH